MDRVLDDPTSVREHVVATFSGHFNVIYEMHWSSDDTLLVSASSDGVVALWDTETLAPAPLKVCG